VLFRSLVLLGRFLKRRHGVRLGWLYQLFALSLAVFFPALLLGMDRRRIGNSPGRHRGFLLELLQLGLVGEVLVLEVVVEQGFLLFTLTLDELSAYVSFLDVAFRVSAGVSGSYGRSSEHRVRFSIA
jgi:hypothetical protein